MHDWYGAILGLLALIGFITSIADSIRKRAAAKAEAARVEPAPAPAPASTVHQQLVQRLAGTTLARAELPPILPPPPPVLSPSVRAVDGTGAVRGMFEGPATLVRAIVAAEVLGPPKSLQEQSIWSPRHSEPSI
jgi:hypothetical protein